MNKIIFLFAALCLLGCKKESETAVSAATEATAVDASKIAFGEKAHLPRLKAAYGFLHLTWVEEEGATALLKYAKKDVTANTWSQPITVTSGDDWFVNWADYPEMAINGNTLLTNVLQKSEKGTYDYDIKLNLTNTDTKITFSGLPLHTDGVAAEHGFVSMSTYDGGYYVSWLDGRNTKNKDASKNQMTLRNAYVDTNGKLTGEIALDTRVCDCCNTATAITINGPVVAYRDRTEGAAEQRDISIVRWEDGKWTAPKTIHNDNWQLKGCPVNGPAVDAYNENLVVSWFTGSNDDPRVLAAFSGDAGKSFKTPMRLDSGNAIGRVSTKLLEDGSALVVWMEPKGAATLIQLKHIYPDGHKDATITVATTSPERASGFPQLVVVGKTAYVAWTMVTGNTSTIEMKSLPVLPSLKE